MEEERARTSKAIVKEIADIVEITRNRYLIFSFTQVRRIRLSQPLDFTPVVLEKKNMLEPEDQDNPNIQDIGNK